VWAANFGALEWHAWTSRVDQPRKPTYALIDLDPGPKTSWEDLLALARLHRTAFEHMGVVARPKVTGRRGIQIWVPIARGPDFGTTRAWVERLSKSVGMVVPELVSWKWNVDEPAALVWAANFGALEWHAWTSRVDQPRSPTYALIDLDPGPKTSWEDLLTLARLHRTAFEHMGVVARPKVTGRRGIQIWVPIARGPDFGTTRGWVERLSKSVGMVVPELVSWKWNVDEREGLARLDYTQNAINKTLVAPYSPRPAAGAPVSAPIDWNELDDPSLSPDGYTIRTIGDRIAAKGDLFADVLHHAQRLPVIK
jgi:DNA primase